MAMPLRATITAGLGMPFNVSTSVAWYGRLSLTIPAGVSTSIAPLPQIRPFKFTFCSISQVGINMIILAPVSLTAITKSVPRTAIAAVGVLIFTFLGSLAILPDT